LKRLIPRVVNTYKIFKLRFFLIITGLVFLISLGGITFGKINDKSFAHIIIKGNNFYVEIATTPFQHSRGLSGRKSLLPGTGMLFLFGDERVRTFWMKDCFVPLDIAFIDANWRIISIKRMTVWFDPGDPNQREYSSDKPCSYVLEVPAGELKNTGVKAGDRVKAILFY